MIPLCSARFGRITLLVATWLSFTPLFGCKRGSSEDSAAQTAWFVKEVDLILSHADRYSLEALDPRTGAVRWRFRRTLDPDPPFAVTVPPPLRCSPQVTPSSHIVLRFREGLYSLDPKSGQVLWMRHLRPELCATVTPDSGTVVVDARRKALTKLDDKGEIVWTVRLPLDGLAVSSPQSLWPSGDVIVRTRTHVVSISPTGIVNWTHANSE